MNRIDDEDLKKISLNILTYIHNLCVENNLKYYLGFGSLIGAIRHKGFIPWDDDIDIIMERNDYNKLIELLKNNEKYKFLDFYNNSKEYYFTFGRITDTRTILELTDIAKIDNCGVFIDVFPMDNEPVYPKKWLKKYDKLNKKVRICLSKNIVYSDNSLKTKVKIVFKKISRFFYPYRKFNKYCNELNNHVLSLKNNYNAKNYFISGTPYGTKTTYDKKIFNDITEVEFEGFKFYAPIGWDDYLRLTYGDYMKLPPIEKQKSHHHFKAFWK